MSHERAQQAADAIAGLDEATPESVYRATLEFPARAVAAAAATVGGNGGSQPWQLTSVPLSSANLLATNTGGAVQILPPLTGRNYYVVQFGVFHYRGEGATPYTGNFDPQLGYGDDAGDILSAKGLLGFGPGGSGDFAHAAILAQTVDAYSFGSFDGVVSGEGYLRWFAASIEGEPVSLVNTAADTIAGGNGTAVVRVFYSVIDGAP